MCRVVMVGEGIEGHWGGWMGGLCGWGLNYLGFMGRD